MKRYLRQLVLGFGYNHSTSALFWMGALFAAVALLSAGGCKKDTTHEARAHKSETKRDRSQKSLPKRSSTAGKATPPPKADPVKPATLQRRPTVPDPHKGSFSVAKALDGLTDSFNENRSLIRAAIRTSKGTLDCELLPRIAPLTVANFVGLARGTRPWWDARDGKWVKRPYYEGTSFHRVIPGFMIQGGDYLGDGSGGVGYEIPDEIDPSWKHSAAGLLCMANRGPNTNGGQFFVTDAATPHLDGGYTIFGTCTPLSLVAEIARVPQAGSPTNRPLTPVVIRNVSISVKAKKKGVKSTANAEPVKGKVSGSATAATDAAKAKEPAAAKEETP